MKYKDLSRDELNVILAAEQAKYGSFCARKLQLDISRGKPCKEQLDLSMGLFNQLDSTAVFGMPDYRNYGILDGIPEMKRIISECLSVAAEELIVAGNSSLTLMYDTVQRFMQFGVDGVQPAWNTLPKVKFLCPVPGYDRHFSITELFGVEMIQVPTDEHGPVMSVVEELVRNDEAIKGIWCVPKYSNPTGIVYSDEVVTRFANMTTAAKDFRIFWDNAYFVHSLNEKHHLLCLLSECKKAGNAERVVMFGSTSKITFPGAGVAFMCSAAKNIAYFKKLMGAQSIGPDKITQLAHANFLKSAANIEAHMAQHSRIIAPKFDLVLSTFSREFGEGCDIFRWTKPLGGYFISVNVLDGCAKEVWRLCKEAGLTITPAGATYPLRRDEADSNLRIAPTYIGIEQLGVAVELLVNCIKIAAITKLLADK